MGLGSQEWDTPSRWSPASDFQGDGDDTPGPWVLLGHQPSLCRLVCGNKSQAPLSS